MELHEQFKKFRQQNKISQTKLAKWAKVGRATIYRFETGKSIMTDSFNKMIEAMDGKILILNKDV